MTTVAFLGITAGAVAFLVYVLVQFRRDQNRTWPTHQSNCGPDSTHVSEPQLRIVGSPNTPGLHRGRPNRPFGGGRITGAAALLLFIALYPGAANCQEKPDSAKPSTEHERALLERIEKLERRLAELEARTSIGPAAQIVSVRPSDPAGVQDANSASLNNHYGFDTGRIDPFPGKKAYMAGTALANRIWFHQDRFALTVRGEVITNPTRYLALLPTANGFPLGADNYSLKIWGLTGTFDYMPTDFMDFRSEFISRHANVPFFAGRGGTTSTDGFQGTPGVFFPDVSKHENRLTFAVNFRM